MATRLPFGGRKSACQLQAQRRPAARAPGGAALGCACPGTRLCMPAQCFPARRTLRDTSFLRPISVSTPSMSARALPTSRSTLPTSSSRAASSREQRSGEV